MGDPEADALGHSVFNFYSFQRKGVNMTSGHMPFPPTSECQLWSSILVLERCSGVNLACSASLVTKTHGQTLPLLFCSPAQGCHCREMVISEENVCPGHPSVAVIRQCKSQSKVQLTHSELCWLSRTKRQNNKKIRKPLFRLGVAAPAISPLGGQFWQVWRYVLTVFFYVKS